MKLWRYGQSVEYLGRRYRLDGMLGSGGMADVCLAWDEREQREVALKILKSDDLDQETLNRFMKEAAQIAHWQHPHILRVYETLQVELIEAVSGSVLFYMVSEYARGGDLQKRLLTGRPFPLSASFALFRQLCDAVQYAHEHGVIHRDLKPLNVLFRRPANGPEEVVLSDFGLAVQVEASHHTFAHGGTLAYMAPEQFQGHALPASDIFALGVVIYLLCTGGLPFRRSLQDMTRIVQGRTPIPTRPSLHNPELPPNLDEVILRALRELPAERYRQPRDFWEAIEQVLTTNARTFPFVEEYGQNAGQTWPYDSSEQLSRRSRQAGQQRQFSSTSAEFPDRDAPELEEGPISALWIAREKQKASPVHLPLPTHSIPSSPNPSAAAAPDEASLAEDAPEQYVDAEDALERDAYTTDMPEQFDFPAPPGSAVWQPAAPGERDPWERPARAQPPVPGANAGNSARPHAPRSKAERQVRESRLPGSAPFEVRPAPDTPAPRQRPAASSSGSTILPAPRQVGDDLEQTSRRRQPFAFGTDPQTSRRQPTRQFSDQLDSQSRGQPPLESSAYDVFTAFAQPEEPAARSNTPARPARRAPVSRRAMPDTPAMPARAAPEASVAPHPQRAPAASSAAYSPPYRAPARRAPARVMARSPRAVGRHRLPLVIVLGGLLLLGLLCAIFAATGFQGAMLNFFGAPIVRVTLQPASHSVQQDTTLHIRTDGGQLAADEIPGRQLTSTSPTQSATANATGSTQGKQATGILTLINNTSNPITVVPAIITDSNGVQVSWHETIVVPAAPPASISVLGFAIQSGEAGNITVLDIVKQCCTNGIVVKNTSAFTGGKDAIRNGVIQQKDIDGAAQGLVGNGKAQALGNLLKLVRGNERVLGSAQCQSQINASQQAGDVAKQVIVQVAITCSETVYDYDAARQVLTGDLQRMASADPALGRAYALSGQVALIQRANTPAGDLQFHAQGLWVYQFTPAILRGFATLIAGKSSTDARALLLRQPGILAAQFSSSSALPVNTSEIQISVQTPSASS